ILLLPLELIDSVTDLIDGCSDLLSLALTCRSLNKHLIPSVLNYHEIRAPFEAQSLGNHLVENARLSGQV
ncbi:hypothetical protein JAAARDRAFT_99624, partial [Jaapia argillacea MUCL 33604]